MSRYDFELRALVRGEESVVRQPRQHNPSGLAGTINISGPKHKSIRMGSILTTLYRPRLGPPPSPIVLLTRLKPAPGYLLIIFLLARIPLFRMIP